MTEQLMASDADLTAWAKAHGPDYLRYAAERGHTIKASAMDAIAEMVAKALGGRVVRPSVDLIDWKVRQDPSAENVARRDKLARDYEYWVKTEPLPEYIIYSSSGVVRVEEQPDPPKQEAMLKYSGVVLTLKHPATAERFVVVNLEASR